MENFKNFTKFMKLSELKFSTHITTGNTYRSRNCYNADFLCNFA